MPLTWYLESFQLQVLAAESMYCKRPSVETWDVGHTYCLCAVLDVCCLAGKVMHCDVVCHGVIVCAFD